jgi:hypothetical protein
MPLQPGVLEVSTAKEHEKSPRPTIAMNEYMYRSLPNKLPVSDLHWRPISFSYTVIITKYIRLILPFLCINATAERSWQLGFFI